MPLFSIVNMFIFQAAWFSAALLRDDAVYIMAALLLLHCYFSTKRQADLSVFLFVFPVGVAVESLMIWTGLLSYQSELTLPVWIVLLWVHLGFCLNHSLQWMQKIPVYWQVVLSGLAGAGSYAAASRFDAVDLLESPSTSLAMIAGIWAVLLPLMIRVSSHVTRGNQQCSS